MNLPAIARRAAPLLLATCLAACVRPTAAPPPLQTATAPSPPPPPALPPEHLDLPPDAGHLAWQPVGGGPLPGGGTLQEYVPAGETIADWSQMITTVTLPPDQDPAARLDAILDAMRAACAAYRDLAAAPQTRLVRCDRPNDTNPNILLRRHEVIWAKTLQGRTQNYIVWRAWHGDKLPRDSILTSAATRDQWQSWLAKVEPTL